MITRKDIAAKANVSVSVVSRVLNNSGYVASEKKEKVIRIAEELGYYPNPVAMSLQMQRTRQIVFYCKDLSNKFNIEMYHGMMEEANKSNYMVVLSGKLKMEHIKNMMVDGIVLPNRHAAAHYLEICGKNYRLPMVSASFSEQIPLSKSLPIVDCDMFKGMDIAAEYLIKNGHKKIGFGVPAGNWNSEDSRSLAYRNKMYSFFGEKLRYYVFTENREKINNELPISQHIRRTPYELWEEDEDYFEKGIEAARTFACRNTDATAVICFNDEFAIGMCKEFKNLGIRVPEDVSVIGFDGSENSKYIDPPLTTVQIYPEKIGEKCIRILLDVIDNKNSKYIVHSPLKLKEGKSVYNCNHNL